VIMKGLGNLTQSISQIMSRFLSSGMQNFDPLIKMVETQGVDLANEMLKNVSIPIFSII